VRDSDGRILRPARTVRVTDEDLEEIVNETASAEAAGQYGILTIGHRDPAKPESDQPAVVGFLKNPRIAVTGPDRRKRIVFDEYIRPEMHAKRGEYPYRSVDYYPTARQVFGAAILKSKPRLNLGTFAYVSGRHGECFPYVCDDDWDAMVAAYKADGGIPGHATNTFADAQPNPLTFFPPGDPHKAPDYYAEAMALVRARPGTSYEAAVAAVKKS
jgi:hypothetical protein